MQNRYSQTPGPRRVGLEQQPETLPTRRRLTAAQGPDDRADWVIRTKGPDDTSERAHVPGSRRSSGAEKRTRSKGRELLSWLLSIGIAVIAAFAIRGFLFEIILVDGESMEPTLYTNERIGIEKVSRYASLPERGNIIIVHYPNMDGTYVKRVIGLPGETVEVRDSTVYINGVPLQEDYVSSEPYADMEPVIVPEDTVFVMGDNRAHSMDSRASYIGPIARSEIIGHGLFVLWPFDSMHMIDHAEFS